LVSGTALAAELRDLGSRLEAVLTPMARRWCDTLRQRVRASPLPPVTLDDDAASYLRPLTEAIRERKRVELRYRSPASGESQRTIEPYLLWHAAGGLYVVALDDRSGEVRTFAVQRIRDLRLLDETFEADDAFDAAGYIREGFGVFHDARRRIVVDFDETVAYLLRERIWHPSQRLEDTPSGVRATWHMSGLPEIARWLAGFGGDARVVSPAELAEQVRRIHEDGLAAGSQGGS
jgi:proteasome accessory factor B